MTATGSAGGVPSDHQPRAAVSGLVDAVVLGSGVNLIEVVRALSIAGVRSGVVPGPAEPARLSRHVTTVAVRDWADPQLGGEDEFVEKLVRYGLRQSAKPPLLFTSDEALLLVSAHRQRLAEAFRFVIARHTLVINCADKGQFAGLAARLGLPVPATLVLAPGTDWRVPDVAGVGFPLVLKPERRDRAWHSGLGIRGKALHLETPEELAAVWPALRELGQTILLQRAVPGGEDRMESYHVYVDELGQVVGEFTGRKIRTLPTQYGHTTALVVDDAEDVRRCGQQLVAALGLVGVAKFDFKRDDDGRLHLLEVNPRFQLWHHPGARAGANIPDLVHADLTGRPRPPSAPRLRTVHWCHPDDWFAGRRQGLGRVAWARWALRCPAKAFWAWDDPLPLVAAGVKRARR